jgi:arylsulfatase A-like enzyme
MRPNFVFILADDLGYADLGCYGARDAVTPALDRIAGEGLRFTDGYANSPVCSPTRFALMTGRYQYRFRGGAEEPLGSRTRGNAELGLPPALPTLPSLLRASGYATALVGKWHLGYPPHFGPCKSGYEWFFGSMGGAIDYFSHRDRRGVHDLYEGDVERGVEGYATDLFTARAVEYIERRQGDRQPFFLSVHYTAPHWPWETRHDAEESRRIGDAIYHVDGGSLATYREMIREMDEGIASIVDALQRTHANDDTLLVFTSDNGGERYSDNWPFVGQKMDLLEGGIRVQLAITMDWVATMLASARVEPHPAHPLDGMDLTPVLRDPAATVSRTLYWRMKHRAQRAVRHGNWKYLSMDGDEFLYDLAQDARERANLASRWPDTLREMRERYARWGATMPPMPDDAAVHLVYGPSDVARPTG